RPQRRRGEGGLLLLGCGDGKARFWDVAADREVHRPLAHAAPVTAVAWSPDGLLVLIGCRDGTVHLWDATRARELLDPLRHEGPGAALGRGADRPGAGRARHRPRPAARRGTGAPRQAAGVQPRGERRREPG